MLASGVDAEFGRCFGSHPVCGHPHVCLPRAPPVAVLPERAVPGAVYPSSPDPDIVRAVPVVMTRLPDQRHGGSRRCWNHLRLRRRRDRIDRIGRNAGAEEERKKEGSRLPHLLRPVSRNGRIPAKRQGLGSAGSPSAARFVLVVWHLDDRARHDLSKTKRSFTCRPAGHHVRGLSYPRSTPELGGLSRNLTS